MLMSEIYLPFCTQCAWSRKIEWSLKSSLCFQHKKTLRNVLVLFNRAHNPVLCIWLFDYWLTSSEIWNLTYRSDHQNAEVVPLCRNQAQKVNNFDHRPIKSLSARLFFMCVENGTHVLQFGKIWFILVLFCCFVLFFFAIKSAEGFFNKKWKSW